MTLSFNASSFLRKLFRDAVSSANVGRDFYEVFMPANDNWYRNVKSFADKCRERIEYSIIHSFKTHFSDTEFVLKDNIVPKTTDYFVIDSISGIENFVRSIPEFAVSLSYIKNNVTVFSAIFMPIHGHMIYATKDNGAYLEDPSGKIFKLRILENDPTNSIVSFLHFTHKKPRYNQYISLLNENGVRLRSLLSPAVEFIYLVTGKINGIMIPEIKTKSLISGLMIAQESGAILRNISGEVSPVSDLLRKKEVLILTPNLAEIIL